MIFIKGFFELLWRAMVVGLGKQPFDGGSLLGLKYLKESHQIWMTKQHIS